MKLSEYLSAERGRGACIAAALDVAPQQIYQWASGSRGIPAEHCPAIERATNGAVRCEDLRPDVDWAYLREAASSPQTLPYTIPAGAKAREAKGGSRQPIDPKKDMS